MYVEVNCYFFTILFTSGPLIFFAVLVLKFNCVCFFCMLHGNQLICLCFSFCLVCDLSKI